MSFNRILFTILIAISFSLSCQQFGFDPPLELPATQQENYRRSAGISIDELLLDQINSALDNRSQNYRVGMAEYITSGENNDEIGRTVFFRDLGNKQLSFDFVPFDPRRLWSGPTDGQNDNVTYLIDQVDAVPPFGGLTAAMTSGAIKRAMDTWDNAICSNLDLLENDDFGLDWGVIAFIIGLGGGPFVNADVMHTGFTDIDFSGGIIGGTFTFGFVDSNGEFTDVNNDGKLDAAFREIYYDPSFLWAIDDNIDVETIALHEAGHGLSQGHFGKLFQTTANGKFHFAPRAVMNAGYTGFQQTIGETDNAGHCSIWGDWPQN